MTPGEGLYTDMHAVRKDYFLDHDHSAYVDQWDWELAIKPEQRTLPYLTEVVEKIMENRIHRVLVLDSGEHGGSLVGIISVFDLVQLLA